MTSSQEDTTHQELHVDEMAAHTYCENCGWVLKHDHGIIRYSEETGVTWWQCPNPDCNSRFKEEYRLEFAPDQKITLSMVEV